jgi:hypothetical protein
VWGAQKNPLVKKLLVILLAITLSSSVKAQLVFKNVGRDTMRVAVGVFYDTAQKAMSGYFKPVIVSGWYKLYPGDSVVIGPLFGPAVYYSSDIIRSNRYIIGDTLTEPTGGKLASYREELFIKQKHYRDGYADIRDTSKFTIKHPVNYTDGLMTAPFRVVVFSEDARRRGRLVIPLGRPMKG